MDGAGNLNGAVGMETGRAGRTRRRTQRLFGGVSARDPIDMETMNEPRITRNARAGLTLAFLALTVSGPIQAQAVARSDSVSSVAAHPALYGWREAGLSALGTGLLVSGHFANVRYHAVPTHFAPGYDAMCGLSASHSIESKTGPE